MQTLVQAKPSKARRRRLAGQYGRLRATNERPVRRAALTFWADQSPAIVRAYEKGGDKRPNLNDLLKRTGFRDEFNRRMIKQWQRLVYVGIEFQFDVLGRPEKESAGLWPVEQKKREFPPPPSISVKIDEKTIKAIQTYLRERERGVWKKVARGTKRRLAIAIGKGLDEGDTLKQIADRIGKELKKYSRYQSTRVARSETTGSMNHGQQLIRSELEIDFKTWISTLDLRTRGQKPTDRFNHIKMDGKRKGQDELFKVSEELLLYPGDTAHGASGANVIHCRCGAVAF